VELGESLEEPVSSFMSKEYAQVGVEESIYHAARAMQSAGTTEAVVTENGAPVGMITERDILYKVVAAGLYPQQVKAKDIMSSPLESVEGSAKAKDAIAKMSKLGIRRLGVTVNGKIAGIITQKAVAAGSIDQSIPLPELAAPSTVTCPYCGAKTKSREELSKHIDHTHMGGAGLLQGDLSKW
jgi:CBS domain-containing protein